MVANNKQIVDALEFEIQFFKKEVQRLQKQQELVGKQEIYMGTDPEKEHSFRKVMGQLSTPARDDYDSEKRDKVNKMEDIVAKAQASISKVVNSPFGRLNMNTGGANDSLDAMRLDFMQDYHKIMRESGETFFKSDHPALSAQKMKQLS